MSTEICIHGNDPMTCDERPDGRCHVPKRPCPECGKDATEVCVHMQRLLAAIEEPRMSTDDDTRFSSREHWLKFDECAPRQCVVGRQCGFGADPDDNGYGDSVVDHIAAVALAGAERQVAAIRALHREWVETIRTESQIMTTAQRSAWTGRTAELAAALGVTPTEPDIEAGAAWLYEWAQRFAFRSTVTWESCHEEFRAAWLDKAREFVSALGSAAGSVAPTEPPAPTQTNNQNAHIRDNPSEGVPA